MEKFEVTFDGVPLCETYGLTLAKDGFTDTPPATKRNKVSIPGGIDIDITEALGGVAYSNRTQKFTFAVPVGLGDLMERVDALRTLLHGQRGTYTLSWDSAYSYVGRWELVGYTFDAESEGSVAFSVDASPFKRGTVKKTVNAWPEGSVTLYGGLDSSTVRVTCAGDTLVEVDGVEYQLGEGTSEPFAIAAKSATRLTVASLEQGAALHVEDDALVAGRVSVAGSTATINSARAEAVAGDTLTMSNEQLVVVEYESRCV